MTDDQYTLDVELRFANGDTEQIRLVEGCDTYEVGNAELIIIRRYPDKENPETVETTIVRRDKLNYMRIERRKLKHRR